MLLSTNHRTADQLWCHCLKEVWWSKFRRTLVRRCYGRNLDGLGLSVQYSEKSLDNVPCFKSHHLCRSTCFCFACAMKRPPNIYGNVPSSITVSSASELQSRAHRPAKTFSAWVPGSGMLKWVEIIGEVSAVLWKTMPEEALQHYHFIPLW